VAPRPRRGQIWRLAEDREPKASGRQRAREEETVTGPGARRVLVYSGDMFNELPDLPYVITMEVGERPEPMDIGLPDGSRVAYTRLNHVPKALLGEQVGEVPHDVMERINTRLFMVIATR
jgi:mRNA-degrading endonuclease toxin of MazEF toxin-antitoxin module